MTCHGTVEQEGSLPTATKFHQDSLKNGVDPFRMYQTLTRGYGMMVPQPQYSAAEKYAVIQYIRESFLKTQNPRAIPAGAGRLPRQPTAAHANATQARRGEEAPQGRQTQALSRHGLRPRPDGDLPG